jgi:hypothetical protein
MRKITGKSYCKWLCKPYGIENRRNNRCVCKVRKNALRGDAVFDLISATKYINKYINSSETQSVS